MRQEEPPQQYALLCLMCQSKEVTNHIIQTGLNIHGKELAVWKMDQDARHCLKCQFFGRNHIAKTCDQIHDTCGTCASIEHRTDKCEVRIAKNFVCVNCRVKKWQDDHPSWDRLCPIFLEIGRAS